MKKKKMILVGLLMMGIGCGSLYVNAFPHDVEVEVRDMQEENLSITIADVEINDECTTEIEKALSAWEQERTENREAAIVQYREEAKAEKEAKGDAFYGFVISEALGITFSNENVLSFREEKYEYLGDDNMHSYIGGVNFNAKTGEILQLEELLEDASGFRTAAVPFIVSYVNEVYKDYGISVTEEQMDALWDSDMGWYLEAGGITAAFDGEIFETPEIQNVEVPLTLADLETYIKPEYFSVDTTGVYKVRPNVPLQISAGEAAKTLLIEQEEMEYNWNYSVSFGTESQKIGEFIYLRNAYYLQKEDGSQYLLMDFDMASDDYMTYLFEIKEDSLVQTDLIDGGIDKGSIQVDSMEIQVWLDILGTYGAEKTYTIDENGKFVTEETEYRIRGNVEDRFELVSTVELPFYIDGKATPLPAGTGLRMITTDGETYAVLQVTESGKTGELPFVHGEGDDYWNLYIGEKNVIECFEILPYVG